MSVSLAPSSTRSAWPSSTRSSNLPATRTAATTASSSPPTQDDDAPQWKDLLLQQRVLEGATFDNVALNYAADLMKSEAARIDGQLVDDFASLLRGNAIYIHNFLCNEDDLQLYCRLKDELVASTGAAMAGAGGLIEWSKHQVFDNPTDISQTFNSIIDMLSEYFDVEVYATRLNYYRDGTQWKPQHHDSHAYGGRAEREDFTVGLTLGAERSLVFVHEASGREFSFPQKHGDCFAFTGEVNQLFTHGVPRMHTPVGDRFSIIAWGRRRTLNERNGGVPNSAAKLLEGVSIETVEDAIEAAKRLVASQAPPPRVAVPTSTAAVAPPRPKKKNRLQ